MKKNFQFLFRLFLIVSSLLILCSCGKESNSKSISPLHVIRQAYSIGKATPWKANGDQIFDAYAEVSGSACTKNDSEDLQCAMGLSMAAVAGKANSMQIVYHFDDKSKQKLNNVIFMIKGDSEESYNTILNEAISLFDLEMTGVNAYVSNSEPQNSYVMAAYPEEHRVDLGISRK